MNFQLQQGIHTIKFRIISPNDIVGGKISGKTNKSVGPFACLVLKSKIKKF